jgi:hypothetical protein
LLKSSAREPVKAGNPPLRFWVDALSRVELGTQGQQAASYSPASVQYPIIVLVVLELLERLPVRLQQELIRLELQEQPVAGLLEPALGFRLTLCVFPG